MLTEHEAQRPQELLNSIYNTVPCGILRIRKTQQGFSLVSINPAAVRLLGYAPGQDLTEEWEEGIASTVLPEDRAQLLNAYPLLPNQGERVWSEYRVRWQDGSIHWLQGSNTVVYQNQHEQSSSGCLWM